MPYARHDDPETSHAAAESVRNVRQTHKLILHILHTRGPSTDEEVWQCIPNGTVSVSGARSRRSELVGMRMVRDSGRRGKTKANRQTIIWEINP